MMFKAFEGGIFSLPETNYSEQSSGYHQYVPPVSNHNSNISNSSSQTNVSIDLDILLFSQRK